MDIQQIDRLFDQDWVEIQARVLNNARKILARIGLRLTSTLGKGQTAVDLVDEAIAELLDNPHKADWDLGLVTQISRRVRQRIYNCLGYNDNKKRDCSEYAIQDAIDTRSSAEEGWDLQDEVAKVFELLRQHRRVKGHVDYELVVDALADSVHAPEEIAKGTGLKLKRVYDIRQALTETYTEIRKQMTMKGEQV